MRTQRLWSPLTHANADQANVFSCVTVTTDTSGGMTGTAGRPSGSTLPPCPEAAARVRTTSTVRGKDWFLAAFCTDFIQKERPFHNRKRKLSKMWVSSLKFLQMFIYKVSIIMDDKSNTLFFFSLRLCSCKSVDDFALFTSSCQSSLFYLLNPISPVNQSAANHTFLWNQIRKDITYTFRRRKT